MVVCPRFVWWRWLALPVVAALAGPVAAQTAATDRLTPVPRLPSLAQRIDPIVPPVERVAPSAPRLPVAVVPGVKRVRAGVAAVTPPSAANVPAPTGVQAIGSLPNPRTARNTGAARPGALAPSSRSSLGATARRRSDHWQDCKASARTRHRSSQAGLPARAAEALSLAVRDRMSPSVVPQS